MPIGFTEEVEAWGGSINGPRQTQVCWRGHLHQHVLQGLKTPVTVLSPVASKKDVPPIVSGKKSKWIFVSGRDCFLIQHDLKLYQMSRSFQTRLTFLPTPRRIHLPALCQEAWRVHCPLPGNHLFSLRGWIFFRSWTDFPLILPSSLQFPFLILSPTEVWLHWLVALFCQQLGETEAGKQTVRGQETKQPEEPICQLKSSGNGGKIYIYSRVWGIKSASGLCVSPFSSSGLCFLLHSFCVWGGRRA